MALVLDAGRGGGREGRLEADILTKTRLHQHLLGGGGIFSSGNSKITE